MKTVFNKNLAFILLTTIAFAGCNVENNKIKSSLASITVEDMKERIFRKGVGKNTGLGLFLTREILDITGLSITETGNEGEGARFEIAIPLWAWERRK